MRKAAGITLMVLGVLFLLAGAALALWVGPDNRAVTGPHPIETDRVAVVTDPEVLGYSGPVVSVQVEVPGRRPVFVGVGNPVDVGDYLAGTAVTRVESFGLPWDVATSDTEGRAFVPAAPTDLDWWYARSAGEGGARLTFTLPEQPAQVAVVAVGANDLRGLQVSVSHVVPGGFGIAMGLLAVSFGLVMFGWIAWRRAVWEAWEEWDAWQEAHGDADDEPDEAGEPDEKADVAKTARGRS